MPLTKKFREAQIKSIQEIFIISSENRISITHFISLLFVDYYKDTSVHELASYLFLSTSATSRLIDKLVKRKLITRGLASTDSRLRILKLTDEGKRVVNSMEIDKFALEIISRTK